MVTKFQNKAITANLVVLPSKEVDFMDEASNYAFSESQMKKLKKVMGFGSRRISIPGETVSEYAIYGIKQMLADGVFKEEEIGAIIVTTTSPDQFIPPVSNIIQGAFDFDLDTVCIDISQGCCGFVVGLTYAFMTAEHLNGKKVLLVAGDMLSQRVSVRDRASRPITGDGVAICVVENDENGSPIYASLKNMGKECFAVQIPAGGTRIPITPETVKEEQDEFGNWRGKQHLVMEGDKVFNIIINETPVVIEELLKYAGKDITNVEYFLCHQSSVFTLKKLAQRLGVDQSIMPNNIVPKYGNSSSATIPVTLMDHHDEIFAEKDERQAMFAAFGTGMSLGAVMMNLKKLDYCKMIEYPHKNVD